MLQSLLPLSLDHCQVYCPVESFPSTSVIPEKEESHGGADGSGRVESSRGGREGVLIKRMCLQFVQCPYTSASCIKQLRLGDGEEK